MLVVIRVLKHILDVVRYCLKEINGLRNIKEAGELL